MFTNQPSLLRNRFNNSIPTGGGLESEPSPPGGTCSSKSLGTRLTCKCATLFRIFWQVTSIGFHGNVVSVWEKLAQEYENGGQLLVELGSDQTSCHNPHSGGYYPVQLTYSEAQEVFFLFVCPVLNCTRAIDPADDLMENVGIFVVPDFGQGSGPLQGAGGHQSASPD